jgi:hypothetical protein
VIGECNQPAFADAVLYLDLPRLRRIKSAAGCRGRAAATGGCVDAAIDLLVVALFEASRAARSILPASELAL